MEYPGDDPTAHNIEKLLVCIDYPGKVVNPDKAIETLGGLEEVSKVGFISSRRDTFLRHFLLLY